MIAVRFNKAFAQSVIDALNSGKPIRPPSGSWTGNEMLTLAGMLYAGVFSQGPHSYQLAGLSAKAMAMLPKERQEAVEGTFRQDILDSIEFLSMLMFHVMDGEYDEQFHPDIAAVVYRDGENRTVLPAMGFRDQADLIE